MTTGPDIARPLARYSPWRRAGDFLLLSGVIAVDPTKRLVVRGFADLPAEARAAAGETGEFSVDARDGAILAQSWFVLDRVRSTLEAAGGRMDQVVRLVQYFKDLDHFPRYSRVRNTFFPGEPPASTVVQVSAMLPTDDILIEVEATAFVPLSSKD